MRRVISIVPAAGGLLLILILQACAGGGQTQQPAAPPSEDVEAVEKTVAGEWSHVELGHRATLALPRMDLMTLSVEPDGQASGPPLPMARRVELWRPLIERTFAEKGRLPAYTVTVGEYPELAARIAVVAASSGEWDTTIGTAREGEAAVALQSLLADGSTFPELRRLFDPLGYSVRLESAESVMVCRWSEIEFIGPDAPLAPDLPPDAQVPCGALLVFRISEQ